MRSQTRAPVTLAGILWLLLPIWVYAQSGEPAADALRDEGSGSQTRLVAGTLDTLSSFVDLRNAILKDIQ